MRQSDLPASAWAFISLGRPLFLVGGFVFFALGAAVAAYAGHALSLPHFVFGQIAVTATQWMTHYSNDYFDLEADRLNPTPTRWTGGSRVLPEGRLQPRTALIGALALMAIALLAAVALALSGRLLAAGLVLLGIAAAWEYTAPPLRLNTTGFGELAATLTVTGLTPLVGFSAQAGGLSVLPLLVIIPLCCLQLAMLLTVAFPDAAGDAAAGKRTLVVRLGGMRAARLHNAALVLAYLLLPVLVLLGLPPLVGLAMALSAPVAGWQAWRVSRGAWADTVQHGSVAFIGIGLLVGTAALALAAFLLLMLLA